MPVILEAALIFFHHSMDFFIIISWFMTIYEHSTLASASLSFCISCLSEWILHLKCTNLYMLYIITFTNMVDPFFIISIILYELRNILISFYQWCVYTNNNKLTKFNPYCHLNVTVCIHPSQYLYILIFIKLNPLSTTT